MDYLDDKYIKNELGRQKKLGGFLDTIRKEADGYFAEFDDSPEKISRWAHHYFCPREGGRLIYDRHNPHSHVCSLCGTGYTGELLDGAWLTMYRNDGAVNAWKSALIYRMTGERPYLKNLTDYVSFYARNYNSFRLHNKDGREFGNGETPAWGCSRIMPQNLNEAIFLIRLTNALEMVRDDLEESFIGELENQLFTPAFELFKPQVHKVHNIPCWLNSAIGVMGLFLNNREMIDFMLTGEFNINRQLDEGVTKDFFWYEGSIHYNCFLLEGLAHLLLFSELKGLDFSRGKEVIRNMLLAVYSYAFDNHRLPNPNDGWPDVNLKTYTYIYAMAVKVFGEDSDIGRILGSILNKKGERGTIPLSRPYYWQNDISLEECIFTPGIRQRNRAVIPSRGKNFASSHCGLLKKDGTNLFLKYGHNGPSHAHPDKMTVEVILGGVCLSRDLSNSGYGNPLCNEWHRVSASHNTVIIGGENQTGFAGGECLIDEEDRFVARAQEVYENVDFARDVKISGNSFADLFKVTLAESGVMDYFFHVEGTLAESPRGGEASLGYGQNGYQHIRDVVKLSDKLLGLTLEWLVDGRKIISTIKGGKGDVFIARTPDNPVINERTTLIWRQRGLEGEFAMEWKLKNEE